MHAKHNYSVSTDHSGSWKRIIIDLKLSRAHMEAMQLAGRV